MNEERTNRVLLSRNSYAGDPIQVVKLSDNSRNVEVVYHGKHLYLKQSFRLVPDGTYKQPVSMALIPYLVIDGDVYPMATFASFMTEDELGLNDLEDDVVETPEDREYDEYLDKQIVPLINRVDRPRDIFAEDTTKRIKDTIKPKEPVKPAPAQPAPSTTAKDTARTSKPVIPDDGDISLADLLKQHSK